jgi:REP element-mobilizing transposase RayT
LIIYGGSLPKSRYDQTNRRILSLSISFRQSADVPLRGKGLRLSPESRYAPSMRPPPLTEQPEMHYLPRLAPEFYRGFAVVQWTITLERRTTGWLDAAFHLHFRELMLHVAAREGLFCPVYVLMPDHLHLLWMGLRLDSDQRNAMKFLRKHLAVELARRSPTGVEYELQKQSHDSVLREKDRWRGAFEKSCFDLLDNPCRKKLVDHPRDWRYLGAIVPGYPFLHPMGEDFWEQFWKLYQKKREPTPA